MYVFNIQVLLREIYNVENLDMILLYLSCKVLFTSLWLVSSKEMAETNLAVVKAWLLNDKCAKMIQFFNIPIEDKSYISKVYGKYIILTRTIDTHPLVVIIVFLLFI